MTTKKCTKKRHACTKLLFCLSKPVAFLPFSLTLTLTSTLLKLPFIAADCTLSSVSPLSRKCHEVGRIAGALRHLRHGWRLRLIYLHPHIVKKSIFKSQAKHFGQKKLPICSLTEWRLINLNITWWSVSLFVRLTANEQWKLNWLTDRWMTDNWLEKWMTHFW